jgi:hypothetical protein
VTEYSKRKPGVSEERKRQSTGMAYAAKAAAESGSGFGHQVRTKICHFAALDIAPDTFGGIEVGRIAGEPLDLQPVALSPEEICISRLR